MFEIESEAEVAQRRAGRIAFGSVLITGAMVLYPASLQGAAAAVMLATWIGAFWLALVVRSMPIRKTSPAIETAALVVPSVGIALMLPLLLHLPFALALSDGGAGYDSWVALSCVIVGPTHLVTAWLVGRRAAQVTSGAPRTSIGFIYGMAVLASAIPFAVLLLIPPILVAITGLPLFALLRYQERIVIRERGAAPELPRALAIA